MVDEIKILIEQLKNTVTALEEKITATDAQELEILKKQNDLLLAIARK